MPQLVPQLEVIKKARTRTRECLRLLEDEVRSAPDLTGISVEYALKTIRVNLDHVITPDGLCAMIARNYPLHTIMYSMGRIRLRRDIVMRILLSRTPKSKRKLVSHG